MDFMSYSSMDSSRFQQQQQQQQQLFDCADDDDTFQMEQLLAAAFDSSSSTSSSELFHCSSNDDDICFDPLYSVSEFFDEDRNDVFLAADEILFQGNLFMSPFDNCYQLGNELNHSENSFNKRQKVSDNDVYYYKPHYDHNNNDSSSLLQGLLAPQPQLIVTQPPQPLPFSTPPLFTHGISCNNNGNGQKEGERSLSAQSLSARQRRRKISEKTKELGKLVPGGQKMNTAEMFEAASCYIKFLQAQFAMLQLMDSSPSPSPSPSLTSTDGEEALQCLVGSALVQEKLYSKEKCIVPKGLVVSLEDHNDIQSNSQISKNVRNLILTFG